MKKAILFSFLILLSCSKPKEKSKLKDIKNTVELSIKRTSSDINKIIWAINDKKVKGIDNTEELQKLYKKSILTNKACRKLIEDLDYNDSKIDLKKEAMNYIEFCETAMTKFFKPVIETDINELSKNTKLLKEMFTFLQSGLETSQKMNDILFQFCEEHGLKMDIEKFDKTKFDDKVLEVEKSLSKRK